MIPCKVLLGKKSQGRNTAPFPEGKGDAPRCSAHTHPCPTPCTVPTLLLQPTPQTAHSALGDRPISQGKWKHEGVTKSTTAAMLEGRSPAGPSAHVTSERLLPPGLCVCGGPGDPSAGSARPVRSLSQDGQALTKSSAGRTCPTGTRSQRSRMPPLLPPLLHLPGALLL